MAEYISQQTISEVYAKADIVSVVGEYTKLQKRGMDYWGCCPFHSEKTPSFSVSPEKNAYHCFGCNEGGRSAIHFIQKIEKVSFPESVKFLASKFDIPITYDSSLAINKKADEREQISDLMTELTDTFHYILLKEKQGKEALDYLHALGFTDETLIENKIGYCPSERYWLYDYLKAKNVSENIIANINLFSKKYPKSSYLTGKLVFPNFNAASQCAFLSSVPVNPEDRNICSHFYSRIFPFWNTESAIYNRKSKRAAYEKREIILCDNVLSCLLYQQYGFKNAITVSAPIKPNIAEVLAIWTNCGTVIIDSLKSPVDENLIYVLREAGLSIKLLENKKSSFWDYYKNLSTETINERLKASTSDYDFIFNLLAQKYDIETENGRNSFIQDFEQYLSSITSEVLRFAISEQILQRIQNLD